MATVLVVDDDHRVLNALAALIELEGHKAVTAFNGVEAMCRAREERPALIVTDYMMPLMNGSELVRALSLDPNLSDVPVVMISAVASLPDNLTVSASLRKPFPVATLIELIRKYAMTSQSPSEPLRLIKALPENANASQYGVSNAPELHVQHIS